MSEFYNIDCNDYMAGVPDKYFELAIVDPPYGIGESNSNFKSRSRPCKKWSNPSEPLYKQSDWDNYSPDKNYFDELFRISTNQIIFGANHFISKIPFDSSCWIVWDKKTGDNDFADCEIAWTSFKTAIRKFSWMWSGFKQEKGKEIRIHPTQKPVALYKWLLKNYAKPGDKIFDSHVGSGSIRIACHDMGFDFEGCEIDKDYWEAQEERFKKYIIHPDSYTKDKNSLFNLGE